MAEKENSKEVSRRRFLGLVFGGIGATIATAVTVPLAGYFLSPAWKQKKHLLSPIANVSDLPEGKPTFVTYEQRVRDGWYISTLSKGAWVLKQSGGEIIVFDPRCTHLNCPYYWDKEKQWFQCPCHDGRFDIHGLVIGGPAPRGLDRLDFTIEGDSILVSGDVKSQE
jgi:menaquinol-cytochrome c reductase iron-sulfur subunit